MCTAPQNRYELITETILLLQNFLFSKMSDENEHSNSEFYYPGELFDAELLQLPTYYESTERNSTLLTSEEVHNFIRSQQQNDHMIKWGRARQENIWFLVRTYGLCCARSVSPDLEPNTFLSGPLTQSINTNCFVSQYSFFLPSCILKNKVTTSKSCREKLLKDKLCS